MLGSLASTDQRLSRRRERCAKMQPIGELFRMFGRRAARLGAGHLAVGGAMSISSGVAPLGSLTVDQIWSGLLLWARGDARFVPSFVETELVSDDGREIRKIVRNKVGVRRDVEERAQISTIHDGKLITHEYLDGPWFMAVTGIDTSDPAEPALFLTTLRHTLHPEYQDPEAAAEERGLAPPPTPQQNVERILGTMREIAAAGEI